MIRKQNSAKTQQRPKKPEKAKVDRKAITATIAKLDEIKTRNPRLAGLISLFKGWLQDESGYDEETWPQLKKALDQERDRVGARRLFRD